MSQGACKKCCRHSPMAFFFELTLCSFVCMVLSGVVIGEYFTLEPDPKEIFVGSMVSGILAVSTIGSISGLIFLLVVCLQKRKKQKQNTSLARNGIVRDMNGELESDDKLQYSYNQDDFNL